MVLTPAETGLTDDQFAALYAQQDHYTYQVLAERENLDFSLFANDGGGAGFQTDAIILDGYIFRSNGTTIVRFTLATASVTTVSPSAPSGLTAASTYSLATNGSTLYVFTASATGIQMNSSANYGAGWAGWSTLWSTADQTIYSGNLARDGIAAASDYYSSATAAYPPQNAFDISAGATNLWTTSIGVSTGWISYDFGAGISYTVTRYKINGGAGGTVAPKNWTFEGSNNNSSWTTLDTQTNQTAWAASETRVYSFSNSTAYRYYRLNISANNGATQIQVGEITFHSTSADEAVILVAAATYQRVHFIFVDGTRKVYYPYVLEYTGSWGITGAGIALTDRPYNLTVAVKDTTDFLLLETNTAGRVVDALTDNVMTSNRHKSGGLITFHYKNDAVTWSTHYEVEILDELAVHNFIRYSHIKNLNGMLHVTAQIGGGTDDHPISGIYDYTSLDGIHWSARVRLYLGATQSIYGCILLQSGEYAYAVEFGQVWQSLSTRYTGYTALVLQEDISTYVSQFSISSGDMAQLSMQLDNADGYFDDHAFIRQESQLLLTVKFGGFVDGVALLYPVGLFEMDTFGVAEDVPEHMIAVTARDYMARMTEKVNSDQMKTYTSYLLGLDNYTAKSDQSYGSLAHVYTVSGQVESSNNVAAVMRNNEGIAFCTFADDIWNGEVSCGILITGGTTSSSAGIIFRAKNATHFWAYVYDYTTDKVQLWRKNLSTQTLYSSAALSWTATIDSSYHYLRVRFLYGEIRMFTSTDGITWTLQSAYQMDVQNKQAPDSPYYSDTVSHFDPAERGSVGLYGYGSQGVAASYIINYRLNDFNLPLTVEDAFQKYASYARIHETEFNNLLDYGDSAWTSTTGVIADTHLPTARYDISVYDGALYA